MAGIGVFQLWMVALVILGMITLHSSRFWTERARSSGHRGA
jgi:capsid protein